MYIYIYISTARIINILYCFKNDRQFSPFHTRHCRFRENWRYFIEISVNQSEMATVIFKYGNRNDHCHTGKVIKTVQHIQQQAATFLCIQHQTRYMASHVRQRNCVRSQFGRVIWRFFRFKYVTSPPVHFQALLSHFEQTARGILDI